MKGTVRHILFTLVVLVAAVPARGTAQGWLQDYARHTLDNWPAYGLSFVAGGSNGISDALQHKYDRTVFTRWDAQYWNPDISWENKYRNWPDDRRAAYPGARTWLVWTTDGWHLTKTIQLKAMQTATVLYDRGGEEKKWWWPLADIAISSILFSTGFHLSQKIVIQ